MARANAWDYAAAATGIGGLLTGSTGKVISDISGQTAAEDAAQRTVDTKNEGLGYIDEATTAAKKYMDDAYSKALASVSTDWNAPGGPVESMKQSGLDIGSALKTNYSKAYDTLSDYGKQAVQKLDPYGIAGATATNMLVGSLNEESPAYKWQLRKQEEYTNRQLQKAGLSGSGAGVQAHMDTVTRLTAEDYGRRENLAKFLSGQGAQAASGQANILAGTGQAIGGMQQNYANQAAANMGQTAQAVGNMQQFSAGQQAGILGNQAAQGTNLLSGAGQARANIAIGQGNIGNQYQYQAAMAPIELGSDIIKTGIKAYGYGKAVT